MRSSGVREYFKIFSQVSHGILCLTSPSLTSKEGGTPSMLIQSAVKTGENQYFPPNLIPPFQGSMRGQKLFLFSTLEWGSHFSVQFA